MELKHFIKTVLVDIVESIDEARKALEAKGEYICPSISHRYSPTSKLNYDSAYSLYYQEVVFDVAVTAEAEDGATGKAGINVLGINASLGGGVKEKNSSVSRIKFHVPIALKSENPKN